MNFQMGKHMEQLDHTILNEIINTLVSQRNDYFQELVQYIQRENMLVETLMFYAGLDENDAISMVLSDRGCRAREALKKLREDGSGNFKGGMDNDDISHTI